MDTVKEDQHTYTVCILTFHVPICFVLCCFQMNYQHTKVSMLNDFHLNDLNHVCLCKVTLCQYGSACQFLLWNSTNF